MTEREFLNQWQSDFGNTEMKNAITRFILQWRKDVMKYENVNTLEELVECGLCTDLAQVISERFKGVHIQSWDDPVHTWIEFDGYHFDMENPEGVRNWREMNYFKDCPPRLLKDKPLS